MNMTLTEQIESDWAGREAWGVLFPKPLETELGSSWRPFMESQRRADLWVKLELPLREENMSFRNTEIIFPELTEEFVPRTALGRKLMFLRKQAIEAGITLLSSEEVLKEVRRRRGEIEDDEADLY